MFTDETRSRWLSLPDINGCGTARLLVNAANGGPVEARVDIYTSDKKALVTSGTLTATATAGKLLAFAWDLGSLPSGDYELVYSTAFAAGCAAVRLAYRHFNFDALHGSKAALNDRFGLDRPWDDLATAPAEMRRNRGAAARMLQWYDSDEWMRGDTTFSIPGLAQSLAD